MKDLTEQRENVRRVQGVVFGILCDIDDFCREKGIRYFLSGGTCLGAVRHEGFIPWDDDADLMMPRREYERFLAEFPAYRRERYGVGALSLDPEWQRQYARVWDRRTLRKTVLLDDVEMGVFVDIFPIDGLPANAFVRKLYFKRIRLLAALANASVKTAFLPGERYKAVKTVAHAFLRPVGRRRIVMHMEALALRYDFDTSVYVGVSMAAHYGERETMPREVMSDAVYLTFEGRKLPVPAGWDRYLTGLYGDYMTIPDHAEEEGLRYLERWELSFSDDAADDGIS